jgi:hypothetical protein
MNPDITSSLGGTADAGVEVGIPVPAEQQLSPLACGLTAIDAEYRAEHIGSAEHLLFDLACDRQELPHGYAFRFTAEHFGLIATFVDNERRCCPFFAFALDVAADGGPIWLRITGRDGVKEFFAGTIADHSTENI